MERPMQRLLILLFTFIQLFAFNVTVSILPQKFVVDKISNNSINVNVMIPAGSSPVIYSPKPKQLLALKKSMVYFTVGVPFEKAWIDKFRAINPQIEIVSFAKYINKDKNPHIWLDPIFLISEAKVVYETLSRFNPKQRSFYKNNFEHFKNECLKIDNLLRKTKIKNRKFIIFHPNLYYFAKRYSLQEIALEREGKEPTIRYLLKIIKIAKQNSIKIVLTSPEFSQKSAEFLAKKIGGKVVEFSALDYNIFRNLKRVIRILNGKN